MSDPTTFRECAVVNDRVFELASDEALEGELRDLFELVGRFSEASAPDLAPDQVGDCPGPSRVLAVSFVDAFDLSWFEGAAPTEVEDLQVRLRKI